MTLPLSLVLLTFFSSSDKASPGQNVRHENIKLKDEYARFHGTRHVELPYKTQLDALRRRGLGDDCPGLDEKGGNYQKLAGALWASENMPRADWFLISDSDAFFTNWTIDPRQLPSEYHSDSTIDFIGSPQSHAFKSHRYSHDFRTCTGFHTKYKGLYFFNSGVHYMRNSANSRRILRSALCFSKTNATIRQIVSRACNPDTSTHEKFLTKSDQCALAIALEAEPVCHMKVLAQRVLNSHSHASDVLSNGHRNTCSLCRPGDFVCHAYNCPGRDCDKLLLMMLQRSRAAMDLAQRLRDGKEVDRWSYTPNEERCHPPTAYYNCLDPTLDQWQL
eukprot:m.78214 g.78214  ORF g.78214 m.78214 type:complete len:333 (-) comp14495_c0_seq8:185-1183(-)